MYEKIRALSFDKKLDIALGATILFGNVVAFLDDNMDALRIVKDAFNILSALLFLIAIFNILICYFKNAKLPARVCMIIDLVLMVAFMLVTSVTFLNNKEILADIDLESEIEPDAWVMTLVVFIIFAFLAFLLSFLVFVVLLLIEKKTRPMLGFLSLALVATGIIFAVVGMVFAALFVSIALLAYALVIAVVIAAGIAMVFMLICGIIGSFLGAWEGLKSPSYVTDYTSPKVGKIDSKTILSGLDSYQKSDAERLIQSIKYYEETISAEYVFIRHMQEKREEYAKQGRYEGFFESTTVKGCDDNIKTSRAKIEIWKDQVKADKDLLFYVYGIRFDELKK